MGKLIGIVAVDDKNGIGRGNDLPWPRHKEDMAWFREQTLRSGRMLMGANTWLSMGSKPLPQRQSWVMSKNMPQQDGANMIRLLRDAVALRYHEQDTHVIGGAGVFKATLPYLDELLISHIPGDYGCDTFLPFDPMTSTMIAGGEELKRGDLRITRLILCPDRRPLMSIWG